jgi:hypothetical protein
MNDIFGGAMNRLFKFAMLWIIVVTLAISTTGHISDAHLNMYISIDFPTF